MILKKNYLSVYAKSFNWAGFFLPKQTYNECSALYNFCRIIDNIADEKNTLLSKSIQKLGKNSSINKMFTKIADTAIVF